MKNALPSKSTIIFVLTIGSLIAGLAFASVRLLQVEHTLPAKESYAEIWAISQAQLDMSLLADSLKGAAETRRGEAQRPDSPDRSPLGRLENALPKVDLLLERRQAELISETGRLGALEAMRDRLGDLRAVLQQGIAPEQASRLEAEARSFANLLQLVSLQVTEQAEARGSAERSTYLRLIFEVLAAIIGIFITSSILFFRVFRGIRETSNAQRLLRQEQELSDLVINNISNQGIVIFDEWLNCLLWNPGMETLLGIRSADVVGNGMREVIPIFAKDNVASTLIRATSGTSSVFEDAGLTETGRERCLEINCFPLNIAERRLGIAFVRDVTEHWLARRQSEQQAFNLEIQVQQRTAALRQAERRLIAAIETAPEGFAAFDSTGRLLFANERIRAVEPVSIWCRQEMTLPVFLQCFAMCEGADTRLLAADSVFEDIAVDLMIKKDAWAHLSVTWADSGTIFVRLTDITAYKQAATALQSALERERETTMAYRSFVSMVSHQFRTPLAILDSGAQRLLRRGQALTQDELATRVQRMRNATNRLTRLVESVLNAAKLDAGRLEVNPSSCNLSAMIGDLCERQREMTPHADIRFDAPLMPIQTRCDTILIEQVVINLLSNAVKYSGENPLVEVKVWVDAGQAFCSVRDTGIGIPADELSKIFDRFYRARTASGIAGTGIGLNFAQKIMQLHDSSIEVQSHEGIGSIFTFALPIENAGQASQAA
ncbi:sensor histidine kinase [Microvirga pudoricolor]|uniref:sensor histidine kinase n=1 Tax=Microvirga pudoricolor TaxID=2778729 RepID=UPI00194EAC2B|nr:ATP-binding protein [Microvirga pudoricolor]MBM6595557.1 PAS domain S-box protein [Microvirga pudoricolor]